MRDLWELLLRSLATIFPLPTDWKDTDETEAWIVRNAGVIAAAIKLGVDQLDGPNVVAAIPDEEVKAMATEAGVSPAQILAVLQFVMAIIQAWRNR